METPKNMIFENTEFEAEEDTNVLDLDDGNQRLCYVCTQPLFLTPYQTKEGESEDEGEGEGEGEGESEGGDNRLFLHKACASLPQTLTYHPQHPRHPLYLRNALLDGIKVICEKCTRECKGFIYQCRNSRCTFSLDILCATTVKIMHRSHKHELTLIRRRENRFTCAACGLENDDEFYLCDICDFYLHRGCALLPNAILHEKHGDVDGQQHLLALTFAPQQNAFKFKNCRVCSICNESLLSPRSGIYFCTRCDYAIHVKCAISDPNKFHSVSIGEVVNSLTHLPMIDNNEHSNLIQYFMGNKFDGGRDEKNVLIEKIHDHELILSENYDDNENEFLQVFPICNACVCPISPPFYTCPRCSNFYLHKCCANLPLKYHQHSIHYEFGGETCRDQPLELLPRSSDNFFINVYMCSGCNAYRNGFVYGCKDCSVRLDVACTMLPETITYEKHGKSHILLFSFCPDYHDRCHICKVRIGQKFYYQCCSCPNFKLHAYCALTPLTISHKYDRHPLKLTFFEFSTPEEGDGDFCEVCEEGITNNWDWVYQCKECVTLFHIDCIPFVAGILSIVCGETVRVPCHDCPLTSIDLLSSYTYTCGLCKETIEGKNSTLAFECTKCGYWLHYACAEQQWDGN